MSELWQVSAMYGPGGTRRLAQDARMDTPAPAPVVAVATRRQHYDVVPESGTGHENRCS